MGIFGDIGEAFGQALPGLITTAGQLGLQRWLGPEPPKVVYGGGGPPASSLMQWPSPTTVPSIPVSWPTTMPTTMPTIEVPSEVPWGLDPSGVLAGGLFKPVKQTASPVRFITAKNPVTKSVTFWEHAGAPVLFSRDLRVCKRVGKIAARAARGRARRRSYRKR